MKIAILSPFYPLRGGITQFSDKFYLELLNRNDIEKKAFTFKSLYPKFLFPGKTQYVPNPDLSNPIQAQQILNSSNPFSFWTTAKTINQYAPDVLIIAYWMSFFAPMLGIIAKKINKKTKIIALIHNAIPHEQRFFDKPFARFFFKKCDAFIVLSESVKKDLDNLIKTDKLLVKPHPIYDQYGEKISREEACKQLKISTTKKTLLFFGLIRKYKGLDLLIEAMPNLDDSYQLIIAGENYEDFEKYRKLIDSSPSKTNIHIFEEYIPDDQVSLFFSAADVLILPYRTATQSGVIALAYQMEVPMIATNVGGLGDTVLRTRTGVVAEDVSSSSIAKAIEYYFSDPKLQLSFLNYIQEEKKQLTWSSFASSVLEFIKKEVF